jgi:anti-sigma regulatory factor (Ser/Thr protein kinase)
MAVSDQRESDHSRFVEGPGVDGALGAASARLELSGQPPPAEPVDDVLLQSRFDLAVMGVIRRRVADCLSLAGFSEDKADDFLLAVGEIVGNAIKHGGGVGDIRLTRNGRRLRCVITDHGSGLAEGKYHEQQDRVRSEAEHGRGLWLAFTLCAVVELYTSPHGTRVHLVIDLPDDT